MNRLLASAERSIILIPILINGLNIWIGAGCTVRVSIANKACPASLLCSVCPQNAVETFQLPSIDTVHLPVSGKQQTKKNKDRLGVGWLRNCIKFVISLALPSRACIGGLNLGLWLPLQPPRGWYLSVPGQLAANPGIASHELLLPES